ncbi:hypothetical protein ASZ90_009600 [hydrocarbon metagenome]|uniref:Uncharacterized protein n=1 Tax=hydrocarbon metagenome TaxID=938273 RepID=A0A0W8FIF5_9ZZZZ
MIRQRTRSIGCGRGRPQIAAAALSRPGICSIAKNLLCFTCNRMSPGGRRHTERRRVMGNTIHFHPKRP